MKYAIITPTYINHFQFIDTYLKSFDTFVENKKDIPIFFTISKTEEKVFNKIINKYKTNLSIHVLFIEDLFKENKINETPDEYLAKYGRFTFQTAKKFLTMLHIDAEKFLVLDCESMWIKKTNMMQLFDDYFSHPFVIASDIDAKRRKDLCFNQMLDNIYYLLNIKTDKKWFIEHFMWYYEKNILLTMFKEYGSFKQLVASLYEKNKNLNMINDLRFGIFEIVLYYAYLYQNAAKYRYKVINLNKVMHKYLLSAQYEKYLDRQNKRLNGSCGLIEHSLILTDNQNNKALAQIFTELGLNIIRCDYSDLQNFSLQKQFIDIVQPNILAASQNHYFGLNNTLANRLRTMLFNSKPANKLKKHFQHFVDPVKKFINWILEPFSIFYYFIKLILLFIRHLRVFILG